MKLMTSRDFPFGAIGLVHVENRIEQRRPLEAGETVTVKVRATDLRDHPKGRQFDMVTEVGDAWKSWSTYLKREGGGSIERARGDRAAASPTRSGTCPATSAASTPRCQATSTRSTCTR